jgi:hypothetical protein
VAPGFDGQVWDFVHPLLYPVVYGRTLSSSGAPGVVRPPEEEPYSISQNFQWLSSDFAISNSRKVTLTPYINNVRGIRHPKAYDVIPKILECAARWISAESSQRG